MKGLTNNLIGGEKNNNIPHPFHLPFIMSLSCFSSAWPMETIIVHQALYCLQTTKDVWCRMHALIGESNQWRDLSPLQMPVLKLGLPKPFSCDSLCLLLSEREKDGSACLSVPACYSWSRDNLLFLYSPLHPNPPRSGAKKSRSAHFFPCPPLISDRSCLIMFPCLSLWFVSCLNVNEAIK